MFEKRLAAVPAQLFTANGTTDGIVTVTDASKYVVKQCVFLTASTLPNLDKIEVKRVLNATTLAVGPVGGNIDSRSDTSAYTMALSAAIVANEQKRPSVPFEEHTRAVYAEEPAVATRVLPIDKLGNPYDASNPLPVAATFDGTVQVGDIRITAHDDDPVAGDVHSSVRIGGGNDANNELFVNPDGSINVNIATSTSNPGLKITHAEITSVASGAETTILTLVAPIGGYRVEKIEVSGDNVALFRVKVDASIVSNKRSWHGAFNQTFDYENFENGLLLTVGQTLSITVIHNRPMLGSFEATVMAN